MRKHTILIVDDEQANILMLLELLKDDYLILAATNGQDALKISLSSEPDLILLDINMPEMDGYEVCRRLKSETNSKDIPVIFISANNESSEEFKGLDLGAVDYLRKPYQPMILKRRIITHLSLLETRRELQHSNDKLDEIVKQRTAQLHQANEELLKINSHRRDFLRAISHELRTPTNGILGVTQILFDLVPESHECSQLRTCFDSSNSRIIDTIDNALLLAEIHDPINCDGISLDYCMEEALTLIKQNTNNNKAVFKKNHSFHDSRVFCNQDLLIKCLRVLITIAARLSSPGSTVYIQKNNSGSESVIVEIHSHASKLTEVELDEFWNLFTTSRASSLLEDMGLNIPLAKSIATGMKGNIKIHNAQDGIEIFLQLPKYHLEQSLQWGASTDCSTF